MSYENEKGLSDEEIEKKSETISLNFVITIHTKYASYGCSGRL